MSYKDRFLAMIRGISTRDGASDVIKSEPITFTEVSPDRRLLDTRVGNELSDPLPVTFTTNGPIKITGETVTDTSAAFPTAANQTDRVAISILNADNNDSVYIVNTAASDFATEDPDVWEIGPNETLNIEMNDSNKVILVCESGKSAAIKIMEIRK